MEMKHNFGTRVHHSELRTPTQPEPPMVLAYNKVRRIFQIKYSIDFENILQNTHTDLCSSCLAAWLPSSVIQVKNILFEKYLISKNIFSCHRFPGGDTGGNGGDFVSAPGRNTFSILRRAFSTRWEVLL